MSGKCMILKNIELGAFVFEVIISLNALQFMFNLLSIWLCARKNEACIIVFETID